MKDYIKAVIENAVIISLYLLLAYSTKAWWLAILSTLFVSIPQYNFTEENNEKQ